MKLKYLLALFVALFLGSVPPVFASGSGLESPLFQYLLEGNLLYFVIACYTTVMGNVFFGVIIFFASALVYIKTKSLFLVGIFYTLLGAPFIGLFWEMSFFPVIMTVIGLSNVFIEMALAWRRAIR